MKTICALFVLLTLVNFSVLAADLRGTFKGLTGASVIATCGKVVRTGKISKHGKYHITDLPANKACHFIVSYGKSVSVKTSFSTKKNITDYNGIVRKIGNKIIVVRK